jgi:hypothetical protein
MIKVLCSGLVVLALAGSALAQDGIYGSFIGGQKYVNMDPLNQILVADSVITQDQAMPNTHWTFGGEGHVIGAKRWVLGGKGYVFFHNRTFDSSGTRPVTSYLNVLGGVGMGSIGFCIFHSTEHGIRLYPQVGLGVSSFILQYKDKLAAGQDSFPSILADDHMQVTQKIGLITDACVSFDWYFKFMRMFGLGFGPMLHAEVGTTWDPIKLEWMRDIDVVTGGPNLRFFNPYINIGIGIGVNIQEKKDSDD